MEKYMQSVLKKDDVKYINQS